MPNVPRVPGVPNLSSYIPNAIALAVTDLVAAAFGLLAPQWGIFLDGFPALEPDSYKSFDFRQDWQISDYPLEGGSFQTYNKVELPFDIRLRIASGGTGSARQLFLNDIEALSQSLELYDIVTPEKVYLSVNCSHVDLRRTSTNGVGMITADLWFTEIREKASVQFSNTQSPTDAGKQNVGTIQIKPVGESVQQNFDNGTWEVQ